MCFSYVNETTNFLWNLPFFKMVLPKANFFPFPNLGLNKNLPANAGDEVGSLGQEDLLEKEMATHSSIHAWKIPWTKGPDRL